MPTTVSGAFERAQASSAGDNGMAAVEMNTQRIGRLGKKVSDVESSVADRHQNINDDIENLSQRLTMMISFLPRRNRRMVEAILKEEHRDADVAGKHKASEGDEKRTSTVSSKVSFNSKRAEVREFEVEKDGNILPWQLAGETDVKWNWCFQQRNDMGRDLARQFEQMEDERQALEEEFTNAITELRKEVYSSRGSMMRGRARTTSSTAEKSDEALLEEDEPESPSGGGSPSVGSPRNGSAAETDDSPRRGTRRLTTRNKDVMMDKAILPQLTVMEDRLDRFVQDMQDMKRKQEADAKQKLDKTAGLWQPSDPSDVAG
jgi:hypothetical protein